MSRMKRFQESLWGDDSGQEDGDWDRHQPEFVSRDRGLWWVARCRRTLRRRGGGAAGVTD